ncbi:hypothetical protein BDF19DRAFT_425777 [Syncephalis fuscata]|nr:hypothetical protein BDF19DRAFT_425777 [Syncephalis fuscata]
MESDTIYMELNEHDQTTTNVDELDSKHQLPANFFDTTPVNDESVNVNTTNNTQHLPKGFFDNASQEDKVRRELGIDATSTATPLSQDTMDLEWKRFQQALGDTTTTTTTQSITQAMAPSIEPSIKTEPQEKEEQEQEEQNNNDLNPLALLQRRWEDEEEQMQDWRDRLDVLQLRAAETRSRLVTTTTITSSTLQQNTDMNEDEDDSEDEDIDLDNLLLDWRTQQLK